MLHVEEVTRRCLQASEEEMSNNEDKELVKKLNSKDPSVVYSALVKIRKNYVRNLVKMKRLSTSSVLKIIISYLGHPKYCNVSLSIIADACLESNLVLEVIENDGIQCLINILQGLVNDDVQNRACRALGNIAKSEIGFKAVHTLKPVSHIIKFLTNTTNKNCQQTAMRTLRILGKNSKSREIIVRENGIIYIAQLLHSKSKEVLMCSTRALAELTENCSVGCANQMLEMHSFKILVDLCSHSVKDIREQALMSLRNVSLIAEMRTVLLQVGAVKMFIEVSMNYESSEMSQLATLALCCFVDRLHLWSNYELSKTLGLKAILEILRRSAFEDIHIRIVLVLIPLCYEHGVPDILFELEIIQILMQNLKRYIVYNKSEHNSLRVCDNKQGEVSSLRACGIRDTSFLLEKPTEMEDIEVSTMSSIPSLSSEEDFLEDKYFENTKFSTNLASFNVHKFSFINSETNLSPVKNMSKYRNYSSYLHFHSSGGASSNCSPCSSGSNNVSSPNMSPNSNPCSPLADPWSPYSNTEYNALRWSPVLSESPDVKNDIALKKAVETRNISSPIPLVDSPVDYIYGSLNDWTVEQKTSNVQTSTIPHITSTISYNYANKIEASITSTYKAKAELNSNTENMRKLLESNESSTSKKHKLDIDECDMKSKSSDKMPVKKKLKLPNSRLLRKVDLLKKTHVLDECILDLLGLLSFHLGKKTNSEMASKECFSVLMEYMVSLWNPSIKAEKLLLNLVNNRYCFEKLIMSGFVTEMSQIMTILHDPIHCYQCSQISLMYNNLLSALKSVAESDYGVGTLYHILCTSEKPSQLYAVHAIANLIHYKPSLVKLIVRGNGLSILFDFVLSKSQINASIATISICQIYQNLRKTKTTDELDKCCFSKSCDLDETSMCAYKVAVYDVTFCVNGKKVLASRDTICKNSDYFRALLAGHFSEKDKDVVVMQDISFETLTVFFHFLHGCFAEKVCPFIYNINFPSLLELLSESEKFLLFDIKAYVIDKLCHKISPDTLSQVYQVAKIFNSHVLYNKALHYLLSLNISEKHILLKCFEDIMSLKKLGALIDIEVLMQNSFTDCNYGGMK